MADGNFSPLNARVRSLDCSMFCIEEMQTSGMLGFIKGNYNGNVNWPHREKTCLRRFENNTGADQTSHPRSLISAFVIRLLERIISKLAQNEISIFQLVSVAEETGLSFVLSKTRRQVFSRRSPNNK